MKEADKGSSRLIYGCMRIAEENGGKANAAIGAALDAGYTHFDHADIYGGGECEILFGRFLRNNPGVRERIVIIGKCGIRLAEDPDSDSPQRYDFSASHILSSVEASLVRLNAEYLDMLLLHRPDYLMHADEVAQVFDALSAQGKVRRFGVSNFSTTQVDLLQSRLREPLCAHQMEINIRELAALTDGTLDQCQQRGMTPQAWSPLAGVVHAGMGEGLTAEVEARVRAEIDRQASTYACTDWVLVLAWLMLHPAGISPIVGSTSAARITAAAGAQNIDYRREDWYRLLAARTGSPVP